MDCPKYVTFATTAFCLGFFTIIAREVARPALA
jgi:hypothetical protein